jgi:hypothetical protein
MPIYLLRCCVSKFLPRLSLNLITSWVSEITGVSCQAWRLKNFEFQKCLWNYTVCNLFGLTFLTQHNSLEIHQDVVCINLPLFYCWVVFHGAVYHR